MSIVLVPTSVAAITAANAAATAARARQVHTEACKASIPQFRADTATPVELRAFAECVRLAYPPPVAGGAPSAWVVPVVLGVFLIATLVAVVFNAYRREPLISRVGHALLYCAAMAFAVVFLLFFVSFLIRTNP